jgi:hypothetical protein
VDREHPSSSWAVRVKVEVVFNLSFTASILVSEPDLDLDFRVEASWQHTTTTTASGSAPTISLTATFACYRITYHYPLNFSKAATYKLHSFSLCRTIEMLMSLISNVMRYALLLVL